MSDYKELRKLTIKTFHIKDVKFSNKTYIEKGTLYLREGINNIIFNREYIKEIKLKVILPDERDIFVNSIMDFSPIAVKVLGKIGEGITHTLTGVMVMVNGVDEEGVQVAEFGSSEGILSKKVKFNRAGTPKIEDIIIQIDFTLKSGMGTCRQAIGEVHRCCDLLVQEIREKLKLLNGRDCTEKYEYYDKIKKDRKRIVIIKQVAGQGAMYDTCLFANEPCGAIGSRSIIDMGNVPIILSPNEYRDGALRAMH
ncbi:MAG: proline reductase cluster protein PrdD [Clostridium argentinense]|uniref:Proline reductase cluster protein PrdD n=1 Tax=Clostridium faecium TaxID=2762223 RepID=A0ABR8YN33_9CLOT|nr:MULTISPECIES: proline reductase cluster protein PrdD [Clostridium]MBD8045660.1 proline reductase cluster protein PrdD [Clostridium faecium]MBS5824825.1 proline reductase cluster protein PrdD [Clostridium argentinense]MDU1350872.1 proline reductase cluster protein PrdD [Clostridium argentinense]